MKLIPALNDCFGPLECVGGGRWILIDKGKFLIGNNQAAYVGCH